MPHICQAFMNQYEDTLQEKLNLQEVLYNRSIEMFVLFG